MSRNVSFMWRNDDAWNSVFLQSSPIPIRQSPAQSQNHTKIWKCIMTYDNSELCSLIFLHVTTIRLTLICVHYLSTSRTLCSTYIQNRGHSSTNTFLCTTPWRSSLFFSIFVAAPMYCVLQHSPFLLRYHHMMIVILRGSIWKRKGIKIICLNQLARCLYEEGRLKRMLLWNPTKEGLLYYPFWRLQLLLLIKLVDFMQHH